jgi:hypothetical protein
MVRQFRAEHPLAQRLGHLRQQALLAHDRLRRMSAAGTQHVELIIQRLVFFLFGSSHRLSVLGVVPSHKLSDRLVCARAH